jgi:hypothetical protein
MLAFLLAIVLTVGSQGFAQEPEMKDLTKPLPEDVVNGREVAWAEMVWMSGSVGPPALRWIPYFPGVPSFLRHTGPWLQAGRCSAATTNSVGIDRFSMFAITDALGCSEVGVDAGFFKMDYLSELEPRSGDRKEAKGDRAQRRNPWEA